MAENEPKLFLNMQTMKLSPETNWHFLGHHTIRIYSQQNINEPESITLFSGLTRFSVKTNFVTVAKQQKEFMEKSHWNNWPLETRANTLSVIVRQAEL